MGNSIDPNKGLRDIASLSTGKKQSPAKPGSATEPTSNPAAASAKPAADMSIPSERRMAIESTIAATPDIDMARVEKLKQAIAEGNYPVDSERVAEKFIQLEGLLGE